VPVGGSTPGELISSAFQRGGQILKQTPFSNPGQYMSDVASKVFTPAKTGPAYTPGQLAAPAPAPATNPAVPVTGGTPTPPMYDGPMSYSPNADTQAFAQNPEEDKFRKKLREPVSYSGFDN